MLYQCIPKTGTKREVENGSKHKPVDFTRCQSSCLVMEIKRRGSEKEKLSLEVGLDLSLCLGNNRCDDLGLFD